MSLENQISNKNVIGIDFGTTNCCCYCIKRNTPEAVPVSTGSNLQPSVVSFEGMNIFVGETCFVSNTPEKIVHSIKRLMGQVSETQYPIEMAVIDVDFNNQQLKLRPEEITAILLDDLSLKAEKHFGEKVFGCVISVPAAFSENQRLATRNAAKIAGLNCLAILNEPTAAALAYIYKEQITQTLPFLIFDLGGGTCDLTVAEVKNGSLAIIKSHGDNHLGGNDVDDLLVEYFAKDLKKLTSDKDKYTLRKLCCTMKETLSQRHEASGFYAKENKTFKLNRFQLVDICKQLFERIHTLLSETFDLIGEPVDPKDIQDIILVGGSSRMFNIREILKEKFPNASLKSNVNPGEVVAMGAVIQAAKMCQFTADICPDITITDISPMSLGVETADGRMLTLIKKNSKIPAIITKEFTTYEDNQTEVVIHIFQGENELVSENIYIGKFKLDKLPAKPKGMATIHVQFSLDKDFLLCVTVTEELSGQQKQYQLNRCGRGLRDREITKCQEALKDKKETSNMEFQRIALRENIKLKCVQLQKTKPNDQTVYNRAAEILERITNRPNEPKNRYEKIMMELSNLLSSSCE